MRECPKCGAILDAGEKCDCGCTHTNNVEKVKKPYPAIRKAPNRVPPWVRDWIEAEKRP